MSKSFFITPEEQTRYDKIDALTQEEKETLKLMFLKQSNDHLKSIRNNVLFFFYFTFVSLVLAAIISANA